MINRGEAFEAIYPILKYIVVLLGQMGALAILVTGTMLMIVKASEIVGPQDLKWFVGVVMCGVLYLAYKIIK